VCVDGGAFFSVEEIISEVSQCALEIPVFVCGLSCATSLSLILETLNSNYSATPPIILLKPPIIKFLKKYEFRMLSLEPDKWFPTGSCLPKKELLPVVVSCGR
jgi:hypothetical protein